MTREEMNLRLSEMTPEAIAKVERLARNTTYTPREVFGMYIRGTSRLACIYAVFQKVKNENCYCKKELCDYEPDTGCGLL
jgi:hypothetical protein